MPAVYYSPPKKFPPALGVWDFRRNDWARNSGEPGEPIVRVYSEHEARAMLTGMIARGAASEKTHAIASVAPDMA